MERWKIILEFFLIFRKRILSSTNLGEQIIHYIIITKYLSIPTHHVGLRLVYIIFPFLSCLIIALQLNTTFQSFIWNFLVW